MPIEEVNLLSHTRWLIDPIPPESDKTLTNGPAPARAVSGRTAGSQRAAVSMASPVPLSHQTSTGFDQWGHSSDTHTHVLRQVLARPVITWLKGLKDIAFPPFTLPKRKKKNFIKVRRQHLPCANFPPHSPLFLFFFMQIWIDWKERGR